MFYDAGKVVELRQTAMEDAQWHRGAGAGVFLIASVQINLDVRRLDDGGTRVHLSSGFTF